MTSPVATVPYPGAGRAPSSPRAVASPPSLIRAAAVCVWGGGGVARERGPDDKTPRRVAGGRGGGMPRKILPGERLINDRQSVVFRLVYPLFGRIVCFAGGFYARVRSIKKNI